MVLISFCWTYIFFISSIFGLVIKKLLKIKINLIGLDQILGLFSITLVSSLFSFFCSLNIVFFCILTLAALITAYTLRIELKSYFLFLASSIKGLGKINLSLLLIIFIITLAQSSTAPYLLDNETYYVQTIKWLNEFGYVNGLANLHPFFAQNSGLHTLQAALNFSFLSDRFNDINGFILVMVSLFAFTEIKKSRILSASSANKFLIFLVALPFLIQFVSAPSPDLIIFLLTPLILLLFINQFTEQNYDVFKIIICFVLFLCFIKVTIVTLIIPVIVLFIIYYKSYKRDFVKLNFLSGIVLLLFCFKNYIISGYEFFPMKFINLSKDNWELHSSLLEFYKKGTYLSGFDNVDVTKYGFMEKVKFWLFLPKLHGLFNKLYVLLLLTYPFFVFRKQHKLPYLIIYFCSLVHLIIVWNNSPQYRFFFVFILFFLMDMFGGLFKRQKINTLAIGCSLVISIYILLFGINLNKLTSNNFAQDLSLLSTRNLLIPERNSKLNFGFSKKNMNGLEFYSPPEDAFFWSTGSGKLPCVNKHQINYFKEYYRLIPQLRSQYLKDGFKTQSLDQLE